MVDTSVWIDYLTGGQSTHALWLYRQLGLQPIALTDLIYCEILQGIRSDSTFHQVRRDLDRFTIFETGGRQIALTAAENYRFLRSRGFTIRKTIDCLIATFCLNTGHELLHRDNDFDPFERELGLRVLHP